MFVTTRSDGLVRHRAQAPVTVQAISIAYLRWARHPDFDPFLPVLWDLRGHPLEIALDELVQTVVKIRGATPNPNAALGAALATGRLPLLESILETRDYAATDRFTAADVSVAYALLLATSIGITETFPGKIQNYWERMKERPAFLRAKAAQRQPTE